MESKHVFTSLPEKVKPEDLIKHYSAYYFCKQDLYKAYSMILTALQIRIDEIAVKLKKVEMVDEELALKQEQAKLESYLKKDLPDMDKRINDHLAAIETVRIFSDSHERTLKMQKDSLQDLSGLSKVKEKLRQVAKNSIEKRLLSKYEQNRQAELNKATNLPEVLKVFVENLEILNDQLKTNTQDANLLNVTMQALVKIKLLHEIYKLAKLNYHDIQEELNKAKKTLKEIDERISNSMKAQLKRTSSTIISKKLSNEQEINIGLTKEVKSPLIKATKSAPDLGTIKTIRAARANSKPLPLAEDVVASLRTLKYQESQKHITFIGQSKETAASSQSAIAKEEKEEQSPSANQKQM